MSLDFSVYGKDLDRFDAREFAAWAQGRGYDVELHPQFDLTQGGFQPMRIGELLTGMEIDLDEYTPEPVFVKQTFFERLFRKKPELTAFSEAAQDANHGLAQLLCFVAAGSGGGPSARGVLLRAVWCPVR